uniref:Uncharacterized protein n=1 Tax=Arundo donax TaxID=35708 RepID=A0A0A9APD1_ARUDO
MLPWCYSMPPSTSGAGSGSGA